MKYEAFDASLLQSIECAALQIEQNHQLYLLTLILVISAESRLIIFPFFNMQH